MRGEAMRQHARILGLGSAVIATVFAGATTAVAAAPTSGAAATTKPAGYSIASATFPLPNGLQTSGSVTCPVKKGAQTVPFSGGVLVQTDSLGASLNSSFPTAHGWLARVSNASGAASQFTVYAVCAKKPKGYVQQVSGGATPVVPGSTETTELTCPKGDLLTGGGGFTNTTSTLVSLNSTWPVSVVTWGVSTNNFSSGSATITEVVVCAKLNQSKISYEYVSGAEDSNPAGQETATESTCQAGLSVLGGGSESVGPSASVSINSSFPFTGGWDGDVSNTGTQGNTVTTFIVCAS
jgi:hypothetical protein